MAAVEGVAHHSTSRRVWLESPAGRTRLVALRMAPGSYAGTELIDADPASAWQAFEAQGAVLVSEAYAYRNGLAAGDVLYLGTARGERAFRVAARYRSYDANPETVLISRRYYDLFWNDDAVDGIGLYLADGADAAAVRDRLQAIAAEHRPLAIRTNRDLRELSLAIFDRTFIITNVLYWLAVGVAIVGTLGAMLALQMERARELATLRALGVTRAQLGRMVTLQSTVLGCLAGIAAVPLGLLMAALLVNVINRRAFGWSLDMTVTAAPLWQAVTLAAGAALLAGLYPAWRAARRSPALAMREE
ncbi:MAG: FtsX-like permease family protein [Woeseiaceae bacterium]|nr:FtsX-like permease family protein [Woeseiaceae bacterium]